MSNNLTPVQQQEFDERLRLICDYMEAHKGREITLKKLVMEFNCTKARVISVLENLERDRKIAVIQYDKCRAKYYTWRKRPQDDHLFQFMANAKNRVQEPHRRAMR